MSDEADRDRVRNPKTTVESGDSPRQQAGVTKVDTTTGFLLPAPTHGAHIPTMLIDTRGMPVPNEPKIFADMWLTRHTSSLGSDVIEWSGTIGIELRGSSSNADDVDKKSYGVETRSENRGVGLTSPTDVVAALLGPGTEAESDWVLQAAWFDKTLIRNALVFDVARRIMSYAPRTRFVELFVNSSGTAFDSWRDYLGVYLLVEKIKRSPVRVNIGAGGTIFKIDKIPGAEAAYPPILGGACRRSDNTVFDEVWFWPAVSYDYAADPPPPLTVQRKPIYVVFHDPDSPTLVRRNYSCYWFNLFESALAGPNMESSTQGYAKFIDYETFVDFFILNEVFKNMDGYRISTFMNKEGGLARLRMGPVWDFDLTMGNYPWREGWIVEKWVFATPIPADDWQIPFWWRRLLKSPRFFGHLLDRWSFLRSDQLDLANLDSLIADLSGSLLGAENRNYARWPNHLTNRLVFEHALAEPPTYAQYLADLSAWLHERIAWIDDNIALIPEIDAVGGLVDPEEPPPPPPWWAIPLG